MLPTWAVYEQLRGEIMMLPTWAVYEQLRGESYDAAHLGCLW